MNQTERDEQYTKLLSDFIFKEYNLTVVSIKPAKRGFYGETWRLDTSDKSYFIKLVYYAAHQNVYECSFPIIEQLNNNGIDFISKIIKTLDNRLSTRYDGAVLGVFDWIEGENIETDATKIPEYEMLAKVYAVHVCNIQIPCEDFSGNSADSFFEQWNALNDTQIRSLLEKKHTKLECRAKRLKYYANLCQGDTTGFVITHGDAGGNLIMSGKNHYIVDWDNPILAPPERDAWVMGFRDWAGCIFHKALRRNGIAYTLRRERLAYYCYYMFFYWLTWLIKCSPVEEIEDFLSDWGDERIEYADKMQ